jgi:hypothetical protein
MTTKSEKKPGKAKSAAKPSMKSPSGELSGNDLQAVTGGLPSAGGVSSGGPVCVSQT